MSGLSYLLCAATCLLSAGLLLRAYLRRRERLLFWSSLCFLGLMIENVLLYVDVIMIPEIDLSLWRKLPGLAAVAVLVFGLIWDSK